MKTNRRHHDILRLLAGGSEISVEELAQQLGVSLITIRRDLKELAEAKRIARTHGGALVYRSSLVEFAFREKAARQVDAKRAIARTVAALIQPNTAIALDSGTTTLEVARAIAGIRGVTVVTSSLTIVSVLYTNDQIELILLGGAVRKNGPDLTGPLPEENLERFRLDMAIVGADAVSSGGTYTSDMGVARICRAMCRCATEVVLAVDSSKFVKTAFARCLPLSDVHHCVTDDGCPLETRLWLEKAIPRVTYAAIGSLSSPKTPSQLP